MRIGVVILFNLFAMVSIAIADEALPVLVVGTNTYRHVAIFKVSATDIYFTSDRGMANAKLKDLDPGTQKHFNFNPTNAAAIERKQKAADALYFQEVSHPSVAQHAVSPEEAADRAAVLEPGTRKQIWAKPLLNQKMPELAIEKWLNGQPDNRGKFVLIDFWATWDPASRALIPELNDFQKKFGSRMLIVGLSDEPEDVLRKFDCPEVDYFIATDTQARTKKAMEVTGIPHVLIIDPKGIVRWEGFPFLQHYELNEKVVVDIINEYSK